MLTAAGEDLDEGSAFEPSKFVPVRVSAALATPNAVRPGAFSAMTGKRLRVSLRKGDLLLASYFVTSAPAVAALVTKQSRGFTLSVSGADTVHAGDHVDLLAIVRDPELHEWVAVTPLKDIVVLSVGPLAPVRDNEPFPLRRVTFLLVPEQAETILLAVRLGVLHVSVRNPDDLTQTEAFGRSTVRSVLSPERIKWLEAERARVLAAEGLPPLPRPHPNGLLPGDGGRGPAEPTP